MASLLGWIGNTAKKVEKQVNPFDGGATYQNPNPAPQPQSNPTVTPQVQQAITHAKYGVLANPQNAQKYLATLRPQRFNPFTAGVGAFGNAVKGVAEGLVAAPKYFVKTDIVNPVTEVAAQFSHNPAVMQSAVQHSNQDIGLGPKGTNIGHAIQKLAGNTAQLALTAAVPTSGKVINSAFDSVAPKIIPKLITKTVANAGTGAITGAPYGPGSYLTQDGPHTTQGFKQSVVSGAQGGALLGTAGTLVPEAVKGGVKVAAKTKPLGEGGYIKPPFKPNTPSNQPEPSPIPRSSLPVSIAPDAGKVFYHGTNNADLKTLSDLKAGRSIGKSSTNMTYITENPEIAKNFGSNVISGRVYGKHLNVSDLGNAFDPITVPKEFADYSTSPLLSPRDRRVFENQYLRGQADNRIIDATPDIHKYLVSKGYSTITVPRVHSDVNGARTETVIIDPKATQSSIPPPQAPGKGFILKETQPRAGRQDVIVASRNPSTGHLEAQQRTIDTPPKFLQPEASPTKAPTLKPNIELDRGIQDTLRNGTSEDAVQTVIDTTGADLQTASKYVSRVAKQSGIDLGFQDATKNPKLGTISVPTVKEGDLSQPLLNARFVQDSEHRTGQQALDTFSKLSPHDQVLLKDIETGTVGKVAQKAENPQAFTQAEQAIRNYYDTRHAYDRYLGIDVGYRTNYLRQIFTKAEQQAADMQISLKGSNKRPGYTKQRTNETLGADVADALQKDITGASFNHAKLAYEKGLLEATGGKVAKGELVRTPQDGAYQQIQNNYGQDLSVPKEVAQQINSRTYQPVTSKGLQRYDKINAAIKYTKLGGGAFHAVTEAGNFVGQQLTSGKLFTNPKATATGLRTFFSPKTMGREMTRFANNKVLDNSSVAGLKIMPHEILADANVNLGGKLSKTTGIQQLHDATFGREIPYFKLKMFEQKTKGLDPNVPADLARMRSVAKGINSLFGGINREVEGLKPGTFQRMQRFVLATDFTESKIGTALRAINLADRTPGAKLAREAVIGKVLLFAGLAAAGGALSGEYKGKSPEQIAKNILGKFADPSFHVGNYKVALPATHVSELTRPFGPLFDSSKKTASDRLSGFQHYATGRLAAVPGAGFQLVTNKDYSGNRVYGKDYKFKGGEQISPIKTAANVAGMFGPIPFSQASSVVQGKQNIAAGAANIAGLRVTNEKLYSQDATPVKVSFGDNTATLTKDKAIAFNKAVEDQKTSLDKQLQASAQYKSANANDQKAMLTKLHGYITENQKRIAATQNNVPLDKPASTAVQAVNQNKLPNTLAKGSVAKGSSTQLSPKLSPQDRSTLTKYATTTDRTKAFNSDNKAEYQYNLAKYNNDKANGILTSAQDLKAQASLAKEKVGSQFPKNVRDLYSLSKAQLSSYLGSAPNGQDTYSQLQAYDKALKDAGLITTPKFKNGLATTTKSSKGSTAKKGRTSATTSVASYLKTFRAAQVKPIKTPAAPHIKVGTSSIPKFKSVSLKQYSVKKPHTSNFAKLLKVA